MIVSINPMRCVYRMHSARMTSIRTYVIYINLLLIKEQLEAACETTVQLVT